MPGMANAGELLAVLTAKFGEYHSGRVDLA